MIFHIYWIILQPMLLVKKVVSLVKKTESPPSV